jgi:hypothetical protein
MIETPGKLRESKLRGAYPQRRSDMNLSHCAHCHECGRVVSHPGSKRDAENAGASHAYTHQHKVTVYDGFGRRVTVYVDGRRVTIV